MILLACLAWYYSDELKTGGISLLQWMRSFRSTPEFSTQLDNSSQVTITPVASSSKLITDSSDDSLNHYFPLKTDKGKAVHFVDNQNVLIPQLTGMSQISDDNFVESSSSILRKIDQFNKTYENQSFPNVALQVGLYNLIRKRIKLLKQSDHFAFDNLLETDYIKNKIGNFMSLKKWSMKY